MPQMNSRKNRTVVGVKFSDFESERSRFSPVFVRHKHTCVCDLVALSKLHPRLLALSSVQSKETWKYFAQWRLSLAVRDRGMSLQTHFFMGLQTHILWVCKPTFYGSANPYFMGLQTHFLWCVHLAIVFFFNLILMTAIGSRPKPEICFLSGLLR